MVDQNKHQNKLEEFKNMPTQLSISDISCFKDNQQLIYLYKKTEKLVSAIYLLSNYISDKEPIRWQLREMGIGLLSQGLSLSDMSVSNRELVYGGFVSTALKFLSILEIAHLAGIISEMNYKILRYEFEDLIQKTEFGEKRKDSKGLIFSEHFFEITEGQKLSNQNEIGAGNLNRLDKGQDVLSDSLSFRFNEQRPKKKEKSNRQEIIMALLKKNNELGIKDFSISIKDCSEKTIQRELVSLVSKGLVNKTGEKRWSRYSIKV